MRERWTRRRALLGLGAGVTAGIAGCAERLNRGEANSDRADDSTDSSDESRTESFEPAPGSIVGTVVDLDGDPVPDANVAAVRGSSTIDETLTTKDGEFELAVDGPAWVRVSHPDYLTEVDAAAPGERYQLRATPDEGTVALTFGGDVMFGRRFYRSNDDLLSPQFRIDPDNRRADHNAILEHVRPLFESADIGSVNLESPLTTTEWRHPEKSITFTSHPVAADALADAGVTYTALGNNHVFDALPPGFEETVETLDAVGIAHSGAGTSGEAAWAPAVLEPSGISVGFISCTTLAGGPYEVDWSADNNPSVEHTVEQDGKSITVPGSTGVALASPRRLADAVERARAGVDPDLLVVQIHGGRQYQREPTEGIVDLVDAAIEAGADLVVNHHPHVTGGIEYRNGALVAWSLGNFVFDQDLWETFRSYALTVHVTDEDVVRASTNPLLIDGYVPKGATGQIGNTIVRETAGYSADRFVPTATGLESTAAASVTTTTERFDGDGTIVAGDRGWIDEIEDSEGTIEVGRDRFVSGEFGDNLVDDRRFGGPLWRFDQDEATAGEGFGVDDHGGIQLVRAATDDRNAVLEPRSRIPVFEADLTITGVYRFDGRANLSVLIDWAESRSGSASAGETVELDGTDGEFERFRRRLEPPANATHLDASVALSPPNDGDSEAFVDELRLIEWSDEANAGAGPTYNHLFIDGTARIRLAAAEAEHDALEWRRL